MGIEFGVNQNRERHETLLFRPSVIRIFALLVPVRALGAEAASHELAAVSRRD